MQEDASTLVWFGTRDACPLACEPQDAGIFTSVLKLECHQTVTWRAEEHAFQHGLEFSILGSSGKGHLPTLEKANVLFKVEEFPHWNFPSRSLLTPSLWLMWVRVTPGGQGGWGLHRKGFQDSEAVASSGMSGQLLNPWRQSPSFPVEIQLLNCLAGAL